MPEEITDIVDEEILDLISFMGTLSDEEIEALANGQIGLA
tara:strand:- start:428 stop:547 length:120 start_codon:yes stop_codon:yes gene_type:complete